jgi:RNA polymerase sigma factor (sigma-70 family)
MTIQAQAQPPDLDELYRAHAVRLRGRFLRMTRDPALADDLVADAFMRLAVELQAGRVPTQPCAWLDRVGRNQAVSLARRATVANQAMPRLVHSDVAPSPEDEVIRHERDALLREGLAALRVEDRSIVLLAADGYRPEEIARMIGRSGQVTRTRLCRARGRLRERLGVLGLSA